MRWSTRSVVLGTSVVLSVGVTCAADAASPDERHNKPKIRFSARALTNPRGFVVAIVVVENPGELRNAEICWGHRLQEFGRLDPTLGWDSCHKAGGIPGHASETVMRRSKTFGVGRGEWNIVVAFLRAGQLIEHRAAPVIVR